MAKVCYNAFKILHTFMFQSTLDIHVGLTERIQKIQTSKSANFISELLKYTLNYVERKFLK